MVSGLAKAGARRQRREAVFIVICNPGIRNKAEDGDCLLRTSHICGFTTLYIPSLFDDFGKTIL